MVIELLAGTMRWVRGRIAAVGRMDDWIIFCMGWECYVSPTCAGD